MNLQTPPEILQQLGLHNFVCLDFETTGFRPADSEIIEMGAARVVNGVVTDEFQSLVSIPGAIPEAITHLTGIDDAALMHQPTLSTALPKLIDFLGDDPIAAHNIGFDLAFLRDAVDRSDGPAIDLDFDRHIDILHLSRTVLPRARSHSLAFLSDLFAIASEQTHRALDDVLAEIQVLDHLIVLATALPDLTLTQLVTITQGRSGFLPRLFATIYQSRRSGQARPQKAPEAALPGLKRQTNILPRKDDSRDQALSFDPARVAAVFEAGGAIDAALTSYEHRGEQVEMAREICYAYENQSFLMVEAGTGTGKSWAYLIPAIYWSQAHPAPAGRTIVSTNTKNLQDQIFNKDIPFLHETLGLDFQAVVLKGRHNYICLHRWNKFLASLDLHSDPALVDDILPLIVWVNETETGDIEECSSFNQRRLAHIWWQIRSDGHICRGMGCPAKEACFLNRIRRAARDADIVVINHSLMLSDLISDMTVLSDYENLIIDEAHNLEEVATQYFGFEWTSQTIPQNLIPLDSVSDDSRNEPQFLSQLLSRQAVFEHAELRAILSRCDRMALVAGELRQANNQFFHRLQQILSSEMADNPKRTLELRYKNWPEDYPSLAEPTQALASALSDLCVELDLLFKDLREISSSRLEDEAKAHYEETVAALQSVADSLVSLQLRLQQFLSESSDDEVFWIELSPRRDRVDISFRAAPIEVGRRLKALLYDRLGTATLTSATLSIDGEFTFFEERLGLNLLPESRCSSAILGSPYAHDEQLRVLIPSYLPDPRSSSFVGDSAALIEGAALEGRRGTLVLFTSYRMLDDVYDRVAPNLRAKNLIPIAQGKSGSRDNLLRMLRERKAQILFGTQSFWEGIDVPGEALELLIITKMPFVVPSHPVVAARSERIEANGGNSFMEFAVPHAVLRFRQGIGRLIRSRHDRGVVLLLDSRILSSRYGEKFIHSLPVEPEIAAAPEQVTQGIVEWFDSEFMLNSKR